MKHVVFSKVGIKLYFHPKNWNYAGGGFDYLNSCLAIIRHNPENQYYFCQSSDIAQLSPDEHMCMFPENNVHFPYEDFHGAVKDDDPEYLKSVWQPFLWKWFEDRGIKPDFGLFDFGIYFNTNTMFEIKTDRGSHGDYAMPSIMAKRYAMPIVHMVNEWDGPWISMHHDPRSDLKQRDIFNKPFFMAAQANNKYSYKTWNRARQDFDMTNYHQEYFGIQESALIGQDRGDISDLLKKKTKQFGIVCNQSKDDRNAIDRTQILRKYVLDEFEDVEVFGKWDEEVTRGDRRFCGIVPKRDLNDRIVSWKYSLCIPIGKGWATSKYLEMISNGIVPFLHPYYDGQKNTKLPHDFLHVKDAADLKKKIEYLEKGDNYEKFITKLYNFYMRDEFLTGSSINNRFMKKFIPGYEDREPNMDMIGFWRKFNQIKKDNSMEGFF